MCSDKEGVFGALSLGPDGGKLQGTVPFQVAETKVSGTKTTLGGAAEYKMGTRA